MQVEDDQRIASASRERERLQIVRPVQLNRVQQSLIPCRIRTAVRRPHHGGSAAHRLIGELHRQKLRSAPVAHTHVNHGTPQIHALAIGPYGAMLGQLKKILGQHTLPQLLQHAVYHGDPRSGRTRKAIEGRLRDQALRRAQIHF